MTAGAPATERQDNMYGLIATTLIALLATPALAADAPRTEEEKTLYVVGLIVSRQLSGFNLNPAELKIVQQGISDGVNGTKAEAEIDAYNEKVQELARVRIKQQGDRMAPLHREFLKKATMESGAVKTGSGLIYIPISEGDGATPGPHDTVRVTYRGTLPDGSEFDSSHRRGKTAEFRMDGVIACWQEGMQRIRPGGKARLVCPAPLAYGETGVSNVIPPGCPLSFEVELLEVTKRQ
jgi:FKBP-type peptidyl-prolyl cis-trans isomerase FkpA